MRQVWISLTDRFKTFYHIIYSNFCTFIPKQQNYWGSDSCNQKSWWRKSLGNDRPVSFPLLFMVMILDWNTCVCFSSEFVGLSFGETFDGNMSIWTVDPCRTHISYACVGFFFDCKNDHTYRKHVSQSDLKS